MTGAPASAPPSATGPGLPPAVASRTRRGSRLLDFVPLLLAALAETAWIAVAYALLQAALHAPEYLGLVGLLPFTLFGMWAVRIVAPRAGRRWPAVATVLVCGAGVAGWLLGPAVLGALLGGDIYQALRLHPGGFLAGLAVLRGIAHRSADGSEAALNRLVGAGTPLLVLPLLFGGAISEPWRTAFYASALVDIAVFLVAGMLGLAIARSVSLGLTAGFHWRRNRVWLAMLVASVLVIAAIALWGSATVGEGVRLLVTLTLVPLLVVGFFAGLPRVSKRDVIVLLLTLLAIMVAATVLSQLGLQAGTAPGGGGGGTVEGEADQRPTILAGILLVVGAVLMVLLLVGAWMRTSRRAPDSDVPEERIIDFGEAATEPAVRLRRRRQRGGSPVDAPTAYVALLRDLEREERLRRDPAESPAEHARRLRRDGRGALGLDLLAADYELARFGDIGLTAAEHRRGIERWRRLRRILPAARL